MGNVGTEFQVSIVFRLSRGLTQTNKHTNKHIYEQTYTLLRHVDFENVDIYFFQAVLVICPRNMFMTGLGKENL